MYVYGDENECICVKNIRRGKGIVHPAKMMVEFEQNLFSTYKE
jgi:hypothetical protein